MFDRLRKKGEMPSATEALLATSTFLQNYGWVVLVAIVVCGLRRSSQDTYRIRQRPRRQIQTEDSCAWGDSDESCCSPILQSPGYSPQQRRPDLAVA